MTDTNSNPINSVLPITSADYFNRASKTSNVALALSNFQVWLGWYPSDYVGAAEFAGDMLETLAEVNEFEQCLREGMALKAVEAYA